MSTSLTVGAALQAVLPATHPDMVALLNQAQEIIASCPQAEIPTDHVIHGGVYSRTVRIPEGVVAIGVFIKVPTTVVVNGHAWVFVGEGWTELNGYNVFAARAGRKVMCAAVGPGPVEFTMILQTKAKTVEEAEAEFTDEVESLLSRRQDNETVTVTGE